MHQQGCRTFVLDGDNIRHGLNSDLGFSIEDRDENLRRVGETAKLFLEAGTIVLAAFISPMRREREMIRSLMPHGDFMEIYCDAPIDVCERRDPKGLYEKARNGVIKDFTGISSPYEKPSEPELIVRTGQDGLEECISQVFLMLQTRQVI